MSTFDPETFLNQTTTDANSTTSEPVPVGEYTAVVSEVEVRSFQGKKDPSKTYVSLAVSWDIDDAQLKEKLQRDRIVARQDVMLDLNSTGGLDVGKGRNVTLGRLRDAVGLNEAGKPFNFRMLEGQVAKVKIDHRVVGDAVYAEVKGVARI